MSVLESPRLDPLLALAAGLLTAVLAQTTPEPPIPENPRRIAVNAPDLVEIVFALGAGPRVVGVHGAVKQPPAAVALPKIGSYDKVDPEVLLAVAPDLFITLSTDGIGSERARSLGIPVLEIRNERLPDVTASMRRLAATLGEHSRGEELARATEARIAAIRARTRDLRWPRTLIVLERMPGTVEGLSAVGTDNFMDELLTAAGGANVIVPRLIRYPRITIEEILLSDPEVILDFSVHGYGDIPDSDPLAPWRLALPNVAAVRNHRVVILPEGFDLIPGPRLPEIVEQFARFLHPDAFR
jgi:iron complex transport system substrate-binding protein